jgi:hypothetical protein
MLQRGSDKCKRQLKPKQTDPQLIFFSHPNRLVSHLRQPVRRRYKPKIITRLAILRPGAAILRRFPLISLKISVLGRRPEVRDASQPVTNRCGLTGILRAVIDQNLERRLCWRRDRFCPETGLFPISFFLGLTTVIRMFSYCYRNCFVCKLIQTNVCLWQLRIDNLPEEFSQDTPPDRIGSDVAVN